MKAEHQLKLKALEHKPRFEFKGNQKGLELGEVFPLYNLHLDGHKLNGSTIAIETIKLQGFLKEAI